MPAPATVRSISSADGRVGVLYIRDGARLIICNAAPGFERPNPWTLNLRAEVCAQVPVGAQRFAVNAREANGDEAARYWPNLTQIWHPNKTFHNNGSRPRPMGASARRC
jgi:hypothetical protein